MKLTREVEYNVSVRAIYDGKDLRLTVVGTVPYGKRTASSTIEVKNKELKDKVKIILQEVLESEAEKAGVAAENAAATSRMAAINLGEAV